MDEQMTVMTLSVEELGQTIVTEVERYSKRTTFKYGMSIEEWSELASFLNTELWCELHSKPELHNIRIVRRLINLRTVDYFRNKGRFDNQTPFIAFQIEGRNHTTGEMSVEDSFQFDMKLEQPSVEDQLILSQELTSFISTLSKREKQILKLVSEGYRKNEICGMLGISINTPKNTMKKIKEKAIDFGLESLFNNL